MIRSIRSAVVARARALTTRFTNGSEIDELRLRVGELDAQVTELQDRLSVIDGRSYLNAERNVRTHSSLQNIAEDFDSVAKNVRLLMRERAKTTDPDSEAS